MRLAASLTALIAGAVLIAGYGAVQKGAAHREASAAQLYPPVGRILDVDGIAVHAWSAGEGPDVVLLHGAGGNLRDFTFDLAGRLTGRYRVTAFDRPGHGYTGRAGARFEGTWAVAGESPQVQARLLRRAAAQLGIERPIVLGHSYGGAVAMAWALGAPEAVAAAVILAGATMPWPGGLGATYTINASRLGGATVVPLISALATLGQARDVAGAVFAPQPVPQGYGEHFGLPLSMRRTQLRANARQVLTLRPHVVEMSGQYGGLDLPVELLHGDRDTIVPLDIHSRPLAERLPDAHLTVLEGIGHMPHHGDPQAVVTAVDRAAARAGLR